VSGGIGAEASWVLDELKTAARTLQNDLDALHQVKLPKQGVTLDDLGHYPAADGLAETCQNANQVITNTLGEFVAHYEELINILATNHAQYSVADDATTQAANDVKKWV
jgi:hypothetical protein